MSSQLLRDDSFSAVVEGVQEYALFLLDDRGRIVSWNRGAERAKLFPPGEVLGQSIARLYPPEAVAKGEPYAVLDRAREHGNDFTEGWRLRRDGSRFWASVVTTALYGGEKYVHAYLKIVRDETARHVEEEAETHRKEWLAVVAHELRQPLGVIVTSIGQVMSFRSDEGRLRSTVDRIVRNAFRLERMIHDLTDFSLIYAGQLPLVTTASDVEAQVRAAVERAAARMPGRRIVVDASGPLRATRADPDRLARILDNLLSNALRYSDTGTDVTITLENVPDGVAVAITNQGRGIAPKELSRLFQPFERGAASLRARESIGLGLYIVKGLIEAHGGHIEATSTPGAGTTFRFVLPAS